MDAALIKRYNQVVSSFAKGEVTRIDFGLFSTNTLDRLRAIDIVHKDDLNSKKMGPLSGKSICETCDQEWKYCPGHIGTITVPKMIHPLMRSQVMLVLTNICVGCGELKVTEDELKRTGIIRYSGVERMKQIKEYITKCKIRCRNEKTANKRNPITGFSCSTQISFIPAKNQKLSFELQYEIVGNEDGYPSTLKPEIVYMILKSIPDDDASLMGFNISLDQRPVNYIMERLVVLPSCLRPNNNTGSSFQSGKHDFTTIYGEIITKKIEFDNTNDPKVAQTIFEKICKLYKNDSDQSKGNAKMYIDYMSTLNGKNGLMRYVIGKRCSFVARSVAGPTSTLEADEIGVPRSMKELTLKVKVMSFNIEDLQDSLERGEVTDIVITNPDNRFAEKKIAPTDYLRETGQRYELQIGDVVHRHLRDGDYVSIERAPVIQRESFRTLRVKMIDDNILRTHMSYLQAMNMDFDGDAFPVYVLQEDEAYAESATLISTQNNIINPTAGNCSVSIHYHAPTGIRQMILDDDIPEDVWSWVANSIKFNKQFATLNKRLERYNIKKLTGRALFSALLPETFYYKKGDIQVKDGILVSGMVTGSELGNGRGGFIIEIYKQHGGQEATNFISNVQYVTSKWFHYTGFTCTLDDCIPTEVLKNKENMFYNAFGGMYENIKTLHQKIYSRNPTKHERDVYESSVTSIQRSGAIRVLDQVKGYLNDIGDKNNLMFMINSKAKGKEDNIAQMMGTLGPQSTRGKRPEIVYPGNRALLSFQRQDDLENYDDIPEARGFCPNEFGIGLTASEFFFYMMPTRLAIVQKSNSTGTTGHFSRRLVKTCEDVVISKKGSVTRFKNVIIQPVYGGDGISPKKMEFSNRKAISMNFKSFSDKLNSEWIYKTYDSFTGQ